MMKRFLTMALLLLLAHSFTPAQTPSPTAEPSTQQQLAREELAEAARAYKQGNFSEAELRSRHALELDPENSTAPFFIARSTHAQYKQGLETPENVQTAERAIEAYKSIFSKDVNNDEAYKAVAFLLGAIGRTDEQRDWIARRAENPSVDSMKRSEAYTFLAMKEWNCSFQITERKENQRTIVRDGRTFIAWRMPRDPNVFDRIKQCDVRGLEFAEQAISLWQENSKAWGYKTNLLLEMVKLSEMEDNSQARDDYRRQADEAQSRTSALIVKEKAAEDDKQKENDSSKKPEPQLWPPPAPKGNP